MYKHIQRLLYQADLDNDIREASELFSYIDALSKQAFIDHDESSLLMAHRILYLLNMAQLSVSWKSAFNHASHPIMTKIKYTLEREWESSLCQTHKNVLQNLPIITHFSDWIKTQVHYHRSNELHPLLTFLRDKANLEQMREFFFQETPLEMLFGDILACMLPGLYGPIKIECLKNYWDEVGHGQDERIHRNLRAKLMRYLHIPSDSYIDNFEWLVCEELALINMYLSLATNRAKHTQLIGVMLATELTIPNRFQYLIAGCRRLGLNDDALAYLIEHTSVDEVHAEDWLSKVVMPILTDNSHAMSEVVLGVFRRLNASIAVLDRLDTKIRNTKLFCLDEQTSASLISA